MNKVIDALRRGDTLTWAATCVTGYLGSLVLVTAAISFVTNLLLLPSWWVRLIFVLGMLGLPLVAVYSLYKAWAARRTFTPGRDAVTDTAEAVIRSLEEERDFYRALYEGKQGTDSARLR